MKVLFSGQVPKSLCYPDENEDVLFLKEEEGILVLADGASESFDSKTWASILTGRFAKNENLTSEWLAEAIADYLAQFDLGAMSWSKRAAFDRGSFSTLLAVREIEAERTINILAVGDSIAVLLDNEQMVGSFPYTEAEEFLQRPVLLSTNDKFNQFVSSSGLCPDHVFNWTISELDTPIVICMTDALGEWALKWDAKDPDFWRFLCSIRDMSELEAIVVDERQAGRMRTDDSTITILSL